MSSIVLKKLLATDRDVGEVLLHDPVCEAFELEE